MTPENELDENAQRPADDEHDAGQEPDGDDSAGPTSMSARVHRWTPPPRA